MIFRVRTSTGFLIFGPGRESLLREQRERERSASAEPAEDGPRRSLAHAALSKIVGFFKRTLLRLLMFESGVVHKLKSKVDKRAQIL